MALAQISPQKRETIECETKREIFAMELVQKERWQILVFFFFLGVQIKDEFVLYLLIGLRYWLY